MNTKSFFLISWVAASTASPLPAQLAQVLPSTSALTTADTDIASSMIDGIDTFLLRETEAAISRRHSQWATATLDSQTWPDFVLRKRDNLLAMLGLRDSRVAFAAPELVATTQDSALVAKFPEFDVLAIRWPAVGGVHGEGLLLVPKNRQPVADIVAIPDADQTPEQFVGLTQGIPPSLQFARRLANAGCRVVVPSLIDRSLERRAPKGQPGRANMTNREFVQRPAYELGRHIIGYELQKVFACIDWFEKESLTRMANASGEASRPLGVVGYGEGGMLASYAMALDTRIQMGLISGYFGSAEPIWQQPVDRNVFGLTEEFGDAELAILAELRPLFIDFRPGPTLDLPSEGGAPGALRPANRIAISNELARLTKLQPSYFERVRGNEFSSALIQGVWLDCRPTGARVQTITKDSSPPPKTEALLWNLIADESETDHFQVESRLPDNTARQTRQLRELDEHNQWLLRESQYVRKEFMQDLDTSSLAAYRSSTEKYREIFAKEVIGEFNLTLLPTNPRSRKSWETDDYVSYEVMLDVVRDVFAYGVLLIPKDLKPTEKRPVVVCQHGLEGRPTDVFLGDHRAYHDFAAKLCEQGFITFAPQNIYIFQDRFRSLQRKANPLGKTLFSVMVPQHQQIVNWLKTHPNVDSDRIAFYGLSYGGKSAMRIPALVTDYCLSICSADFNEWIVKNASTRDSFSYVWTGEYEIFEFNMGSTFNYAEMASLICPRPFMVERGHFDSVGTDEWVAFEYAKIRNLYQAKLGIGDRTEIEWFVGPHTINGQGTFAFLRRHLQHP